MVCQEQNLVFLIYSVITYSFSCNLSQSLVFSYIIFSFCVIFEIMYIHRLANPYHDLDTSNNSEEMHFIYFGGR